MIEKKSNPDTSVSRRNVLLKLGAGLNASFRPAGMPANIDYFQYLYPGFIVLVLLFTAIFATISTVEDRREGFLQSVLVAPISRTTIVMGQALGATTLAWVPSCIFLILAPMAGIRLSAGAAIFAALIMALIAFALTCIGLTIAWKIESTQGFHAIMNLILIPVWLLSGAFWPLDGAPALLRWTMRLNPLTYGMAALRASLYAGQWFVPRGSYLVTSSTIYRPTSGRGNLPANLWHPMGWNHSAAYRIYPPKVPGELYRTVVMF